MTVCAPRVVRSRSSSAALQKNWFKKMAVIIEKVLISDSIDASCRQILETSGISVDYKAGLSKSELLAIVKVS